MAILRAYSRGLRLPGQQKPRGIPRIDFSHPLTNQLASYWYDTGEGFSVDLVTGDTTATETTRSADISPYGAAFSSTVNSTTAITARNLFQVQTLAAPYSFATGFYQKAAGNSLGLLFGIIDSGANLIWAAYNNSNSNFRSSFYNTTDANFTGAPPNNTYNTIVATAVANNSQTSYWRATDGTNQTVGTAASTPNTLTTAKACFGSFPTVSSNAGALIFYGAYWTRVLSAVEADWLQADPYCFLIPPEGEMPALNMPVMLASGSQFGSPNRGILQAYSGGLKQLQKGQVPRGSPRIDWSVAPRGLKVFFLNSLSQLPDLCGANVSYNNTPALGMSAFGPTFDPTIGTNTAAWVSIAAPGPSECSVEIFIYYAGGTSESYLRVVEGSPTGGSWDRVLGIDAASRPTFYIYDGAGATANDPTAFVSGNFYHIVGTSTGSAVNVYVNGLFGATSPAANGGYTGFTNPVFNLGYGKDASGTLKSPTSPILHAAFADKAWTAAEVAQRYADMYGFLVPAEGEMPALFLSGGGGFTAKYRKTLSPIGTRIAARQVRN